MSRCLTICEQLKRKGFASTNVVLGIGSYTYQHVTRDTYGFAMKATYGIIDGKPIEIFKQPKTDNGIKNSAKGLLKVERDGTLKECCSQEEEAQGLLKPVFVNGEAVNVTTLAEIRSRIAENLAKEVAKEV